MTSIEPVLLNCDKCQQSLEGEFIRALDGAYHWQCFLCLDCHEPVASKFFPIEAVDGKQQPLCERDYFRRLNLVCDQCGDALKGPYITAVGKKFHLDHFSCTTCGEVFGADDPYYEHNNSVYCYYHYSVNYAIRCTGCCTAILKQFVEVNRNNIDEHWHPECYMINKFWNVKVAKTQYPSSNDASHLTAAELKTLQTTMEDKVYRIWTVLSAFEDSSAACISAMLMHVSKQSYTEILRKADYFVLHVRVLFNAIDALAVQYHQLTKKDLSYSWEASMLYKQVTGFFYSVSQSQQDTPRGIGFTNDLLSLITGLAQYLKSLIRLGLTAALDLDNMNDTKAVSQFLSQLVKLANGRTQNDLVTYTPTAVHCHVCQQLCDDQCFQYDKLRWHTACFSCSKCCTPLADNLDTALIDDKSTIYCQHCGSDAMHTGFQKVSQLQQLGLILFGALIQLYMVLGAPDLATHSKTMDDGIKAIPTKKPMISTKNLPTVQEKKQEDDDDIHLGDIKRTKSLHMNRNDGARRIDKQSTLMETPSPTTAYLTNQLTTSPIDATLEKPTVLSRATSTTKQPKPHRPSQEYVKTVPKAKFYYFAELGALDHYILKHIAVLYLHEMFKDHILLEELTDLIDDKKNSSLWGKFVTSLKTTGNKKGHAKVEGTFGVALEVLVDKAGVETNLGHSPTRLRVPCLMDDVISALKQTDVSVEGIFRKNGNIRQLKDLCDEIDKHGHEVNLANESAIQLAALLKKFLRDLPEPLLTFRLYKVFTLIARLPKQSERIRATHLACCLLPKPNRDTLEVLFVFIQWVSTFAHLENDTGNKMHLNNLATMIAPNLLYPKSKDPAKDDSIAVIDAVYVLLQHQEEFTTVPEDFVPLLETISYGEMDLDLNVRQLLKKCELAMKKRAATQVDTLPPLPSSQIPGMPASSSAPATPDPSSHLADPLAATDLSQVACSLPTPLPMQLPITTTPFPNSDLTSSQQTVSPLPPRQPLLRSQSANATTTFDTNQVDSSCHNEAPLSPPLLPSLPDAPSTETPSTETPSTDAPVA
ncbi:RhoGAP-domain-containing protein [Hesseltinella vesiculosa]|uniref:RhoGAP-domain-containing protein n=1 Tax=Hesseltinella vesiculosa TaxID=101127 RepID=A0A1X2GGK6_9FUNG|nr:RhoGAP-domain-containing protein [Hesseltinella vesiculosa]